MKSNCYYRLGGEKKSLSLLNLPKSIRSQTQYFVYWRQDICFSWLRWQNSFFIFLFVFIFSVVCVMCATVLLSKVWGSEFRARGERPWELRHIFSSESTWAVYETRYINESSPSFPACIIQRWFSAHQPGVDWCIPSNSRVSPENISLSNKGVVKHLLEIIFCNYVHFTPEKMVVKKKISWRWGLGGGQRRNEDVTVLSSSVAFAYWIRYNDVYMNKVISRSE